MKNRISGYVSYDAYCVSIKWKVAYRSRSFFSHLLVISRFDNSYHQAYLLLRNITSSVQILYPKNDSIYKKKKKKKKFVPTLYVPQNVVPISLAFIRRSDITIPQPRIFRNFTIDTLPTDILFPHRKPSSRLNNPFSVTKRTD